MATQVLTNPKIYVGEYDLSGDHSAVALTYAADMLDDTAFGDETRSRKGGLKLISFSGEGFWSGGSDLVDDALFAKVGVADQVVTVAPDGVATAARCYLFRAINGGYEMGAQIGEMLRFSSTAEGSSGVGMARGQILHSGAETATGAGTKVQVGAVSAAQKMYAALHVISASGTNPTLDVVLQSDADATAGGETARITFTQATGITSEWKSVAGAITDTYWRASFTIGGTDTPTFSFILAVGIF